MGPRLRARHRNERRGRKCEEGYPEEEEEPTRDRRGRPAAVRAGGHAALGCGARHSRCDAGLFRGVALGRSAAKRDPIARDASERRG